MYHHLYVWPRDNNVTSDSHQHYNSGVRHQKSALGPLDIGSSWSIGDGDGGGGGGHMQPLAGPFRILHPRHSKYLNIYGL